MLCLHLESKQLLPSYLLMKIDVIREGILVVTLFCLFRSQSMEFRTLSSKYHKSYTHARTHAGTRARAGTLHLAEVFGVEVEVGYFDLDPVEEEFPEQRLDPLAVVGGEEVLV